MPTPPRTLKQQFKRRKKGLVPLIRSEIRRERARTIEHKQKRTQISASFDNSGLTNFYQLNQIAESASENGRNGEAIIPKNIIMRGSATRNTSGPDVQYLRIIVFRTDTTNTNMVISELFNTADVAYPYGLLKLDFYRKNNARILYDRGFTFSKESGDNARRLFYKKIKLPQMKINYDGAQAESGDRGNLYVLFLSDNADDTKTPLVKVDLLLNYIDP